MTKKSYLIIGIALLGLALAGTLGVQAMKGLTKGDEVALKQEMKPEVAEDQQAVNRIGIFPPSLEAEVAAVLPDYEKVYAKEDVQILDYRGYTLVVPPTRLGDLTDTKARIDEDIEAQSLRTPQITQQEKDIAEIRRVFGTEGEISFNSIIGAYTDEKGSQYNFVDGELVNKQIGITSNLRQKWEQAYPYFNGGQKASLAFDEVQSRDVADEVINKLFDQEEAQGLEGQVAVESIGEAGIGFVYGDNEARVLVDKVTGDIIHYSKVKLLWKK